MPHDVVAAAREAARAHDLPEHHALAVVEIESGGEPFAEVDGRRCAVIRWEGHYLWERLPEMHRTAALEAGLAHPGAGGIPNPRDQAGRYALLRRAVAFLAERDLDPDLAYECVSIGLGQVMGAHWRAHGHASAEAMLAAAHDDADPADDVVDQIGEMFRYLDVNELLDDVRRGDWVSVARGYNGPGYWRHAYHTRLAEAAVRWGYRLGARHPGGARGDDDAAWPTLRVGAKGAAVLELQSQLRRLGYAVGALDGVFGAATRAAVLDFQAREGLATDGVAGAETLARLDVAPARAVSAERARTTQTDLRRAGSSTIAAADGVRAVAGAGAAVSAAGGVVALTGEEAAPAPSDGGYAVETLAGRVEGLPDVLADLWAVVARSEAVLSDHWFLILATGAWLAWRYAARAAEARVRDARAGVHGGR